MSNMHQGNTQGYHRLSNKEQEVPTVSWKKFYVHLAGKTNGTHHGWVEYLRFIGQTEVSSPEESDYILVFCPIVSRVGTDIGEALESTEARFKDSKPIILVVMHHTFNRDHVIAESRRLVNNQNVKLTVDCLFHESELLQCDRNDATWSEVKNFLGVSQNTGHSMLYIWIMWFLSWLKLKITGVILSLFNTVIRWLKIVSWKRFYVHLAGKTNGTHHGWVEKLRFIGQTEVSSLTESDYILVFCPIVSRVGTDIGEALESAEASFQDSKPIILVVMHHTFNRDHVIAESRRLVNKQNVRLTVDCLFHESELLQCDRNDAAWSEVKNFLADPQNTGNSKLYIWLMWVISLLTYAWNHPVEAVVALPCALLTFVGRMWRKYVMGDNSQRNHQSQ